MRTYQTILILKPDLDEGQVDQTTKKITEFIKKSGGSILKLDNWGKKRLAYKVKKHKFGIYLNIYHTSEADKLTTLEKEFQLYELVIKYLVIKINERELERIMKKSDEAEAKATDAVGSKAESASKKPIIE